LIEVVNDVTSTVAVYKLPATKLANCKSIEVVALVDVCVDCVKITELSKSFLTDISTFTPFFGGFDVINNLKLYVLDKAPITSEPNIGVEETFKVSSGGSTTAFFLQLPNPTTIDNINRIEVIFFI
jgi:hypothetical protein